MKSTKRLELSGAFKKNPARKRGPEPKVMEPLGDPPDRLEGEARIFWYELAANVAPGVLTRSDRWCVEIAARCMTKVVSGTATAAETTAFLKLTTAMGMTPADRSKLSVPTQKPANPFTELAAEVRKPRPN